MHSPQGVAKLAPPTGCGGNHWIAATNMVHSLSFVFAQQLPQRGSQGCFAPGNDGRLRASLQAQKIFVIPSIQPLFVPALGGWEGECQFLVSCGAFFLYQ